MHYYHTNRTLTLRNQNGDNKKITLIQKTHKLLVWLSIPYYIFTKCPTIYKSSEKMTTASWSTSFSNPPILPKGIHISTLQTKQSKILTQTYTWRLFHNDIFKWTLQDIFAVDILKTSRMDVNIIDTCPNCPHTHRSFWQGNKVQNMGTWNTCLSISSSSVSFNFFPLTSEQQNKNNVMPWFNKTMEPWGSLYSLGFPSDGVSNGTQDIGWFDKLFQDITLSGQWKAIV